MLDIALIREKPDWVKEQIEKLHDPDALPRVDKIVDLDRKRRELLGGAESLQAHRNNLNRTLGYLRGEKKIEDIAKAARLDMAAKAMENKDYDLADHILKGETEIGNARIADFEASFNNVIRALKDMGDTYNEVTDQIKEVEAELNEHMLWLPNLPHESVPVFASEEDNVPWEPEGEFREFDFEPRPHWELGPELGIIDFERGVRLAGSRAYLLKGWGARLQRALVTFYLDMARDEGFTELYVPFFLNEEMFVGAGQFPKFRDVVYFDPDADIYLLPTAEVAITNIHRDEILSEADLPLYYAAHTPCFRRERFSAGRDVRGIKRVHQFEKVELYKFTTPETSYEELEALAEAASDVCRALQIPFRRLEIVTGDLGFSASKKYDIEMWAPGCQEWLEVSSCSNTESFQARRAMIRYRPEGQKKTQYVHTLNGSALALPRVLIAILENYQQADGSITIPEVLRPYLGGTEIITGSQ